VGPTERDGECVFILPNGTYTITVTKEGFLTGTARAYINNGDVRTTVRMFESAVTNGNGIPPSLSGPGGFLGLRFRDIALLGGALLLGGFAKWLKKK